MLSANVYIDAAAERETTPADMSLSVSVMHAQQWKLRHTLPDVVDKCSVIVTPMFVWSHDAILKNILLSRDAEDGIMRQYQEVRSYMIDGPL